MLFFTRENMLRNKTASGNIIYGNKLSLGSEIVESGDFFINNHLVVCNEMKNTVYEEINRENSNSPKHTAMRRRICIFLENHKYIFL